MGLRKGKSEARRNTHHAWGRRKKKDVRMENIRRARRNIQTWFVRTTRKNGIGFFSRGGRVSKTCPFPDLRRFMENSCPLFRPLSVNNPPMMHLSSKLSMEIPSKLLSNLVQAALSFLSSSILRIHLSTRWYGMQFRCVIDHLFGSGLTCRELNGNERRGSPFGNKSGGTMTVMVELDGSRLRILLFLPWFHVFESYIEHASCNLWKIEIILKILKLEIRR